MYKIENISTPPFAQYSAEEEIDIEAIYYEQQNYRSEERRVGKEC